MPTMPGTASALERLPAIGIAPLNLGDGVHAGLAILVLDIGRNVPVLVTKELQHGHDGRVAFAERQVGTMILFAILEMEGHDAFVVLSDEAHRIAARCRE